MEFNIRFFALFDLLKERGLISSYVQLAEILGTNKAGVNDMKQCRKKISIDDLSRMKISYPDVNIDYILTGNGNPLLSSNINVNVVDNTFLLDRIEKLAIENNDLKKELADFKSDKYHITSTYNNENEITRMIAEPKSNK